MERNSLMNGILKWVDHEVNKDVGDYTLSRFTHMPFIAPWTVYGVGPKNREGLNSLTSGPQISSKKLKLVREPSIRVPLGTCNASIS